MHYTMTYHSPIGDILLACNDTSLIGLWFYNQKHFAVNLSPEYIHITDSVDMPFPLSETIRWLDIYFSGKNPDFLPPIQLSGTSFQIEVWEILKSIPYGKTITYGEIAAVLSNQREIRSMSAQAVGNAVGRNPISIIIPCHRVLGANGSLNGYAGGLWRKHALLVSEGVCNEIVLHTKA